MLWPFRLQTLFYITLIGLGINLFLYIVRNSYSLPVESRLHVFDNHSSRVKTNILLSRNSSAQAVPPKISFETASRTVTVPEDFFTMKEGLLIEEIYEPGHVDPYPVICPFEGRGLSLLVVVFSAPSHEIARNAIRETWGHYGMRRDIAIAFMLGTTTNLNMNSNIEKEYNLYGDLIQGNFPDAYVNLTLKTLSMLEWVNCYCREATYLLKCDDDMFVNISKLLKFIEKLNKIKRRIYGKLMTNGEPIRNEKSKYYVSLQHYAQVSYPNYCTGPSYLLPTKIVKDLYEAALKQKFFKLEDVFITGIVAKEVGIRSVNSPLFSIRNYRISTCKIHRIISIHEIRPYYQYDLWKRLRDNRTKCP